MLYSSVGAVALIIHLLINHSVLLSSPKKEMLPAQRSYRALQIVITIYYVTDILWGILYERQQIPLIFADTTVYFISMAGSVLLWTWFVQDYLDQESFFGKVLESAGWVLFGFEMIIMAINFFFPVLFWFDDSGVYHAAWGRYVTLAIQVAMFMLAAVYAFITASKAQGAMRIRHDGIGMFSIAMIGFVMLQMFFPLLPMYAAGCVIGECVLYRFINMKDREGGDAQPEDRPPEEK